VTGVSLGIHVFRNDSAGREACEQALVTAGVRLPLPHRAAWARTRPDVESWLVALRAADGRWAAAFGVYAAASRALPGFRLLRVERLGEALPRVHWSAAVAALADIVRRERRALRVSVELFSRDQETRATLGALLRDCGFAQAATARNWDRTLALDLQPDQDALLASFSPTARRALRAVPKLPVEVRLIQDRELGGRLDVLLREAFARTGSRYTGKWDWAGVIELSQELADASRLVGLFRVDRDGPDALLGFAWGCWNGESVSYLAGASSRPSDLHRVGIVYPLFWDLIVWAKQIGATWFDLGGVTEGTLGSGDPVGGISDFKRLFSKQVIDVAEDWVFEPRPVPARLAALVSTGADWLSRVARP
jgi:Acetyltransferase (GNAT) domain